MFRSKLLWRLYIGFATILFISTVIVGITLSRQLSENTLEEIQNSLSVRSEMLSEIAKDFLLNRPASNLSAVTQDAVVRLGRATNTRLTVITPEGRVMADAEEQPTLMDNHSRRPEIIEARDSGIGTASRFSQTQQQMLMYRAILVMENQQLLGSVLADMQQDGLSAVYSFFDPAESRRSLGTFMIIDLIRCAAELDLPWLYLGYYVAQSQKMRYKARFQPAEFFRDGAWHVFDESADT